MSDTVTVRPERAGFGAEITGLDISRPLPAETLAAVKKAWADHSVAMVTRIATDQWKMLRT